MFVTSVDKTVRLRLNDLTQKVLDGGELAREEGLWLFGLERPEDLMDLLAGANRIRQQFHGNRIYLCSIVNAKAGQCSENCRFCAQSAHYQTGTPQHGFVEAEPVRQAADEAARHGVTGLGLVAAWKGLKEGALFDEVCARLRELSRHGGVRADASLGIIQSQPVADRLREAGVARYNHNLESSRRFFPTHCSSHTYDDRLATLRFLRNAGIELCVGGILGMGETLEDRCDLALALRELDVHSVPMNFLNPIPGTPLAGIQPLLPWEILKSIACFRYLLPKPTLLLAGGRVVNLRDLQALAFPAGASGLMVGNYLTTVNQPVEQDLQMLRDLGLTWGTA